MRVRENRTVPFISSRLVELLLNKGAEIEKMDYEGKTAVEWAERKGHAEVISLLKKSKRSSNNQIQRMRNTPR